MAKVRLAIAMAGGISLALSAIAIADDSDVAVSSPPQAEMRAPKPPEFRASPPTSAAIDSSSPQKTANPQPQSRATPASSDSSNAASIAPAGKKTLGSRVKAAIQKMDPARLFREREYTKAEAAFSGFCREWEQKLHARETNNVGHLAWILKDGWETASYTGYSTIETCECKKSADGYAIGKLSYEELTYYVVGKSRDEASHAKPTVSGDVHTTELFRWDRGKWFY